MNIQQWLDSVEEFVHNRNGAKLAHFFNPEETLKRLNRHFLLRQIDHELKALPTTGRFVRGYFEFGKYTFLPIVQSFLHVLRELVSAQDDRIQWDKIVSHCVGTTQRSGLLSDWVNVLTQQEAGPCYRWLFPGLMVICGFLTKAGYEADQKAESDYKLAAELSGGDGDEMETHENSQQIKVVNFFRSQLSAFRRDEQRRAAYVILITESIKGCLVLRNMTLAQTFLTQIAQIGEIPPDNVPRVSLVNFKFYLGKLEMQREIKEPSGKAETALAWAFQYCSPKSRLKKSILECLVVVRLQIGKIPSNELMMKYNLVRYAEIVHSVIKGDVRRFENALSKYWREFTEDGTSFALERMKFLVYRTALKNTYLWARAHMPPEKPQIMPIGIFTAALKWQLDESYCDAFNDDPLITESSNSGCHPYHSQDSIVQFDDEEMLCIFAKLISLGWIRGYLSWEQGKIVLSKKEDPFPSLRKIMADRAASSVKNITDEAN